MQKYTRIKQAELPRGKFVKFQLSNWGGAFRLVFDSSLHCGETATDDPSRIKYGDMLQIQFNCSLVNAKRQENPGGGWTRGGFDTAGAAGLREYDVYWWSHC